MIGWPPQPPKWMPIGRSCARPRPRTSASTCAAPAARWCATSMQHLHEAAVAGARGRSPPRPARRPRRRRTIDARSRGSGSSHSAICQSLMAGASAAPYSRFSCSPAPSSGFSTPYSTSQASSSCSRSEGEVGRGRHAVGRPGVGARGARRRRAGTRRPCRSGRRGSRGLAWTSGASRPPRCGARARPRGGTACSASSETGALWTSQSTISAAALSVDSGRSRTGRLSQPGSPSGSATPEVAGGAAVRVVGREHQHLVRPELVDDLRELRRRPAARRPAAGRPARARGRRPTALASVHGISRRRPRQPLSKRHRNAGSHANPASSSATRRPG